MVVLPWEGGSGFVSYDNRQGDVRSKWGHCSVCNIPLSSEQHALDHVNSEQHRTNEDAQRYTSSPVRRIRCRGDHEKGASSRRDGVTRVYTDELADRKRHLSKDSDFDPRDTKRRSIGKEFERISDDELDQQTFSGNAEQFPEDDEMRSPALELDDVGSIKTRIVWIIGTEEIKSLQKYSSDCENYGPNFGLGRFNISVVWKCERGLRMKDVLPMVSKMKIEETKPNCIFLHIGGNDIEKMSKLDFMGVAINMIDSLKQQFPGVKLVWSQLLPRSRGLNATRVAIDDEIATYVLEGNGHYIRYPAIEVTDNRTFKISKNGELDLTTEGILKMMPVLKGGLVSIINRNISIIPVLKNLPRKVSLFVNKNYRTKFANRKPFYKKKTPFYMKKVPFFRR